MSILSIDLSNINLNNIDYNEDHPETIIYVKILVWHSKFEKSKVLKKELNKELKPAACHPRWLGNSWMSEDEKKAPGPILLTDAFYASVVCIVEVLPQRLDWAQNCLWKCSNFDTKNYAQRLDIAQNFSFLILFKPLCSKIYIKKIFQTIQLMKIWYSSKLFLSDFFGTFCPRIFIRTFKTV